MSAPETVLVPVEPTEAVAVKNTDRLLWRSITGAASVFVTDGEGIGIELNGTVRVAPPHSWLAAAPQPPMPEDVVERDRSEIFLLGFLEDLRVDFGRTARMTLDTARKVIKERNNAIARLATAEAKLSECPPDTLFSVESVRALIGVKEK